MSDFKYIILQIPLFYFFSIIDLFSFIYLFVSCIDADSRFFLLLFFLSTLHIFSVPKPAEPTPSTSSDPNPPLTKFLMMDSNQQLSELKKWLHFYHEVSLEEYNKVLAAFKESLQAAKVEKEKLREKETNKNKSSLKSKKKTRTQVKQSKELYDFDTQSEYRKLLFEKIFTVKDKIIQIWKENREHRKNMLKETFSGVVKKLITGDNVKFSGNVVSGRLTEVLCDIKNLEIDRKLGVSGELQSDSFVDLTNKYATSLSLSLSLCLSLCLSLKSSSSIYRYWVKVLGSVVQN